MYLPDSSPYEESKTEKGMAGFVPCKKAFLSFEMADP